MRLTPPLARLFTLGALLLLPFATRTAHAAGGTIVGTIVDENGAALPNAEVQVVGTKLHAPGDDKGHFTITGVPAGHVTLRALVLGYKPAVGEADVTDGAKVEVALHALRAPIAIPQVEVVVGSHARHTAADELAVPVDVYNSEVLARQGTTETGQLLQAMSPAVNFPHQSVTDATDIVKPFTLRGMAPDQTLVLMNGLRVHQTAVVNTFAYGTPAGSSGVDLNTIPSSAIERIEVLRDGASAQYGSDAIAGVVNLVTKRGTFAPFLNSSGGYYDTKGYYVDGRTANINGGVGLAVPGGTLSLFGEFLDREPTNRALPDVYDDPSVPQPNQHWGDGLERDYLTHAELRLPGFHGHENQELYAFGGYSIRRGTGYGYRRYANDDRNWASIFPQGYLPTYRPDVKDLSFSLGWLNSSHGWKYDLATTYGHNDFKYNLENTLNASLGGSLTTPTAPGPDGILGTADDPGIPNQTHFFAGQLKRDDWTSSLNASTEWKNGLTPNPVDVTLGVLARREHWGITPGERASWINGFAPNQNGGDAATGSQVFPGFTPSDSCDATRDNVGAFADLETKLTSRFLANIALRTERYSDFGNLATGKLALRYQPSPRVVFRAALSNGFRAPGLGQMHFSKVVTNYIGGVAQDIGVYPVDSPVARLLGAKSLKAEKSMNLSAGLAITPADGFTVTADVYQVKIIDRILLGATFSDAVTQAILASHGYSTIQGVQYFTNGLDTRTRGFDLTADLKQRFANGHSLDWGLAANYTKTEILCVDPVPEVLAASSATSVLDVVTRYAIERERPDWRGTFSGTYAASHWHLLGRVSYYGTFASAQPGYTDDSVESYGARTLFDTELGYKFQTMDFSVGARNVTDVYPGKPTKDYNNNYGVFPYAAASPFGYNGRYVYTKLTWQMPR